MKQINKNQVKILLLSGIHGDEFGVILSVKKYIENNGNKLPPFIYIPQVSPSAVLRKTRNNINNIDLNRSFFDDSTDEEIEALRNKIKGISFATVFTFHEDCDRKDEFYMYSSHTINQQIFLNLKKHLTAINISLFNGIDDPTDPVLNNPIHNGLLVSPIEKEPKGSLWPWLNKNNNVHYCIDFEIPMKASQNKKNQLICILFEKIISPGLKPFCMTE